MCPILPGRGGTADIHAAHSVSPTRASQEHFRGIQLPLGVLEFCSLCEVELPAPLSSGIHTPYRTPTTAATSSPGAQAQAFICYLRGVVADWLAG